VCEVRRTDESVRRTDESVRRTDESVTGPSPMFILMLFLCVKLGEQMRVLGDRVLCLY
jgi:hypothetical protein